MECAYSVLAPSSKLQHFLFKDQGRANWKQNPNTHTFQGQRMWPSNEIVDNFYIFLVLMLDLFKNYNILTDGKGHVNMQITLAIYSFIC